MKAGLKILLPYLLCAFNGTNYFNSYIRETNSSPTFNPNSVKMMFSEFIKQLLVWAKNSSRIEVWAHNFAGFDGIFLLKHLLPYGEIKTIYHNGRLMAVTLLIKKTKSVKTLEGEIKNVPNIIKFEDGSSWEVRKNLEIIFKVEGAGTSP